MGAAMAHDLESVLVLRGDDLHLGPVGDIALEQDEAPRVLGLHEGGFGRTELPTVQAADEGLDCHGSGSCDG